ncbi:MAG: hypothetical protein NUV57_01145 [archaeon]|nr:hypothetical protein [archaeon]
MNKSILASILILAVLLSGCASQTQGQNTGAQNQSGDTSQIQEQPVAGDSLVTSDEELAALDSELNELESLLNDSDFNGTEFLALDDSTFK